MDDTMTEGTPVAISVTNKTNVSVDAYQYLRETEDRAAMEILPTLIYMGTLALIGDVGNAMALVVYYKRFKPSSTRTYILAMSVLDILFSTFSLPGEILDLRFSLTYDQPWVCRAHRFNSVFLTVGSGFILVAVALDRRRKICHPFRQQLTARQVSLSVMGSAALAAIIAIPFAVLNGRHTVDTELPGITGAACSVDDQFLDTLFPLIYNLLLAAVFIVCVTAMVVSYVQIGRKIVRHKRRSIGLHGTMLATFQLVDRLESGDVSAERDLPLSPSNGDDNDEVFIQSDVVSSSSVHSRHNVRVGSSKSTPANKADATVHPPASSQPLLNKENVTGADAQPPSIRDQRWQGDCSSNKNCTQNGRICRSQSHVKRQREFEMAVETLAQAVSEDILKSSGLLTTTPSSQQTAENRSATDEEVANSCEKRLHLNKMSTVDTAESCQADNEQNETLEEHPTEATKTDNKRVPLKANSPEHLDKPGPSIEKQNTHDQKSGTATQPRSDSFSNMTNKPIQSTSSLPSPSSNKHSLSRFERFNSFLRGSLSRAGSPQDKNTDHNANKDNATSTLRRRHKKRKIPSRTTWMMFILTAIFVISYLPYLTIYSVRGIMKDVETGLKGWRLNLYIIALRSYFINAVVNPIVYSFCSARFRHQCRHLFTRRGAMSISE